MKRNVNYWRNLMLSGILLAGCDVGDTPVDTSTPDGLLAPLHTPEEEMATFQLAPGLRIELVAAEPTVEEPVAMTFDEAGRLWVVEMRGFMPNVDGEGEGEPIGRVVVLQDIDRDGDMDRRTVFLDELVMPRAIAIVEGGVLIAEAQPLWFVEDRDGDLKADGKTLIDPDYGAGGLPEHAPNGLWRGLDNWLYNAKSHFRYRQTEDGWEKDSTEFRGQWGLSHDDMGRLYYNYNWSQLHADLVPPNELNRNPNHTPTSGIDHGLTTDMRIFPIRDTPAVNRGYTEGSLDEDGRLLEFTAASAPLVYRGAALPDEFYGNVFVCEPAANLIKRNIVHDDGLTLTSSFAYPDSEFLASTDERFRPVNLATGPDGALYIADMYRGIIQHGAYMTPYLREQILERGLDKGIHYGRIWRIVAEDGVESSRFRPSDASTEQLVEMLSHPDGWYRDTAQRLLVQKNDPASVDLLRDAASLSQDPLGRLHALWTLEGMGMVDELPIMHIFSGRDTKVQSTILLLLARAAKDNPELRDELGEVLVEKFVEVSEEFAIPVAIAAGYLNDDDALALLTHVVDTYANHAVVRDAVMSSLHGREAAMLDAIWGWQALDAGHSIFMEMLTAAIARKGDEDEIAAVMFRLAMMATLDDRRIAIESGLNTNLYDTSREDTVMTLSKEDRERFALGRQHYLAGCAGCHGNDGAGLARFAPPLAGSEWVVGDERVLIRIVLHGMEGPVEVNGKLYDAPEILPVMPPHSVLDDAELAAILTYIRNDWGNVADPVERGSVGRIRHGSQGQTLPWTAEQLLNLDDEAL